MVFASPTAPCLPRGVIRLVTPLLWREGWIAAVPLVGDRTYIVHDESLQTEVHALQCRKEISVRGIGIKCDFREWRPNV